MTFPIEPSQGSPEPPPSPQPIQPPQPGGPQQQGVPSSIDPSGIWSKFLSTSGNIASPEEVKMFMQGLLKMFNVIIQQQNQAAERAARQMKKAEEGEG